MAPSRRQTVRLGTASPATQANTAETLKLLESIAQRASAKRVDILLLPEAFIGGYPRGSRFGSIVGSRSSEGRNEYLDYWNAAVDLGDTVGDGAGAGDAWIRRELEGPQQNSGNTANGEAVSSPRRGDGTREELERIAHSTGVFIVVGCVERAGGSLYCSAVYVCPEKGVIGKRRKVMPTGSERLIWAQGSPATLRAVSTVLRGVKVNLAAAICWENYMPLVRQALYSQNINLYLAPTADNRDAWLSLMRTVAIEGRCFVISSNMCIRDPASQKSNSAISTHTGDRLNADHAAGKEDSGSDGDIASPADHAPPLRRNSCMTEDGFEIALPSPSSKGPKAVSASKRPQSVLDEEGNEIVLCRDNTTSKKAESKSTTSAVDATNGLGGDLTPPLRAAHRAAQRHMTQSVASDAHGKSNFISRGGSCIIDPFGEVLAGPQWEDDDGIICADVDFQDCIRGRLDLDVAGSYSRNDSFKFSVTGLNLDPFSYS